MIGGKGFLSLNFKHYLNIVSWIFKRFFELRLLRYSLSIDAVRTACLI